MVGADLEYVRRLIAARVIADPVLELGVSYGGDTCRGVVEASGARYFGTDMAPGKGVDYVADFERPEDMAAFRRITPVGTVLVLNVLEHTLDPIRILDNAVTLLCPGGTLVVLAPAIWPLHDFPMDTWRILPNFHEEYARRRGLELLDGHFEYVGVGPVKAFRNPDASYAFPPPGKPGFRHRLDRGIHRVFNTFGRSMCQSSHVTVGAVFVVGRHR